MRNPHSEAVARLLAAESLVTVDEPGDLIERLREPACAGYLVEGLVKGLAPSKLSDKEMSVVHVTGEHHWIGLEALVSGKNTVGYQALAPCRFYRMNIADLKRRDSPELLRSLLWDSAWTMDLLFNKRRVDRFPLEVRVLNCLGDLRDCTDAIEIMITQQEIAELVSASRVKVATILRDLERRDIVELGYKFIRLPNPEALQEAYKAALSQ